MSAWERISIDQGAELKRLCEAYDKAAETADLNLARKMRALISDHIAKCAAGDDALIADLRRELCFPVEISPNMLDQ